MQFGTALEAAREYATHGFCPVPIPAGQKAPARAGWQKMRISPDDVPSHFNGTGNVGIITGEPSGHLHDIDLDSPEAVFLAPALLDNTEMVSGRTQRPESHRWYISEGLPYLKIADPLGGKAACIVEVRGGDGHQTVVAPSIHPSGDFYVWHRMGDPARVDKDRLIQQVKDLGAAAMIARYYPPHGVRHDAALALAGFLLRGGLGEDFASSFVTVCAECHDAVTGGDRAATAEALKDIRAAVRDTAKRLAAGGPATGFSRASQFWDPKVLRKVSDLMGLTTPAEREPAPSADPQATPEPAEEEPGEWEPVEPPPAEAERVPVSEEVYHGLAGRWVSTVAPHTEGDPFGILACFLIAFGAAVGRGPHFRIGGSRHGCNLYVALVGPTSEGRKGTASAEAMRAFRLVGDPYVAPRTTGLSSGEGLIHAIRDAVRKRRSKKNSDGTVEVEEFTDDEGVEDKRLLVIEEELGSALSRMKWEGSSLSAVMRTAWDGNELRILTKSSVQCGNPHIAMIAHITDGELNSLLAHNEKGNGWANRVMFCSVKRPHVLPFGGSLKDHELMPMVYELKEAIEFGKSVGEMERTEEANALWGAIYDELTKERVGVTADVVARAAPIVLRLSMLYALLDKSPVVDGEHLAAAIAFWRASEASARSIFGKTSPGKPKIKETGHEATEEILTYLRDAGPSSKDAIRLHMRHMKPQELRAALEYLLKAKLVSCERVKGNKPGRPSERWAAVERKEEEANDESGAEGSEA